MSEEHEHTDKRAPMHVDTHKHQCTPLDLELRLTSPKGKGVTGWENKGTGNVGRDDLFLKRCNVHSR